MRTLFAGAGATGGYFGGRLAERGKDITFLVRPARAAALARRGLRIHSPTGETTIHPRTVTAPTLDGPYDLIVLAVKSFALHQALADLKPAIGPTTVVVPLLNGMRHIDTLLEALGPTHVYGGVCMIAGTLNDEGDVVQMSGMHKLTYGPLAGTDNRLAAVTDALSGADFESRSSDDIVQEMWEKWVFLASTGIVNVLMRGTIGEVEAAPGGAALANAVVDEALAVAEAAGHRSRSPQEAFLRTSITAKGSPTTTSMYRDLVSGAPVEADTIVADLVTRADNLGVPVPLLHAARVNLAVYQARLGS
ncbi:ketopantoate reductase family protein [Winogradskya consettensis]|uniref:2-dehydropantoate 2-reductase n=1 Tax=Winogradskya consettensis TaxID=113560 RepID=A0A919T211_9ACTN|nr:ketopantoate reductase family protein [Actinoplanes consettensis]GIM81944.1 2-dehydropantoate 2-reductase [Actinoplanes consettensis]